MRRFAIVAICLFPLVIGCQTTEILSNAEKQIQIATIYRQYASEFPTVKGITAVQLQQLQRQRKKVVLVDVRSPKEIAVSYIPGAITAAEFENNPAQYRDATVIAYCTIGYRSGLYAEKLQQQGIEIFNLEGSFSYEVCSTEETSATQLRAACLESRWRKIDRWEKRYSPSSRFRSPMAVNPIKL